MAPHKDTARHSSGSSMDHGLQQCKEASASCPAQKSPPRARNRKLKVKFPLFYSDMGNLPSPSLLFKDLNPPSSQFCKGNQHEMNVERQSGTIITYYFQVICFISD